MKILEAVERGVDFFHLCISQPQWTTRTCLYERRKAEIFSTPSMSWIRRPIEEGCQCPACRYYSRAYIRHLLKAKEMLGMRLCVLHNLYFYNHMMEEIRDAIDAGRYHQYKQAKIDRYEGR